jgi:hypothetical protein
MFNKLRTLRISAASPAQSPPQDRPLKRQRLSVAIPDTVTDDSDSDCSLRPSSGPSLNVLRPLFVWQAEAASPFPNLTPRTDVAIAPSQPELLRA